MSKSNFTKLLTSLTVLIVKISNWKLQFFFEKIVKYT